MERPLTIERLLELAERAARTGRCVATPLLPPPEQQLALAAAKRADVRAAMSGGYEDAERKLACFCDAEAEAAFPLRALTIRWPRQQAPEHRDLLGAVMALGVKRQCLGDIVLAGDQAYLFAEAAVAQMIADSLLEAGRARLSVTLDDELPALEPPEGAEVRDTVQSVRLDAVVASGFSLSRGQAAELITAGLVKLRHEPTTRPDAKPREGDAISVRGYGRLLLRQIGEPTRKGRLPLVLERFGHK